MIYYRKKSGLSIADVWYDAAAVPSTKCDILRFHYIDVLPHKCESKENLFTILIDLSKSEDEIFSGLDKTTKYQAMRAKERDNVTTETFLALGEQQNDKLMQYISFFNDFASSKGRGLISLPDLEEFYKEGTLCIRAIRENETGNILAMHCNVVSDGRARLHQSASHFRGSDDSSFRNLIGRANRYLHWDDILYFRHEGAAFYDFGGWYGGDSDKEKIAINAFKEAFGGEKISEYSCMVPVTMIGHLSCIARKILRKKH